MDTTPARATLGADAVLAALRANGVEVVFGLPGSTEAPLLEAIRRDGGVRYVLTLHENVTVAMADGYARAGARVGVAGLHTSVGTMNGLSQLYNAARDGSPVVVLAGHKDAGVQAEDGFCAVPDLPGFARPFVKHAWQTLRAEDAASDVRRALGVAATPPAGPALLVVPEDVQAASAPDVPAETLQAFALDPAARLASRPDASAVAAAAAAIAQSRRPILVLGADAVDHADVARALAAAAELPVFAIDRTQLAALPFPVRDPRYCGQYGEARDLLAGVDCVVVIGARAFLAFSSEARTPWPADAILVHASEHAHHVGWTRRPAVGLAGETGAVLADLRDAVQQSPLPADVRATRIAALRELRERAAAANTADRSRHDRLAAEAGAVSLVALTDALGATLPPDALVFDEAISSSRALLRHTAFPDGARVHRTNGGALGWAVPAAVGAKIAAPDRAVLAVVGDGSFHFSPQALWTSLQERAPIVVVVVDNGGYLAVKLAIERHLGAGRDDRLHPGTMLGIDSAQVARGYGADVVAIARADELEPALRRAFAAATSTVIVVPVPNVRG